MADILIRGMEIPKGCFYCPIGVEQYFTGSIRCPLLGKGVGYFDEVKNKRDMNCPLVPLPEKHGRLIDADYLLSLMDNGDHFPTGLIDAADIYYAPTIIEAEGGGDNG